jgi:hypothetical protein
LATASRSVGQAGKAIGLSCTLGTLYLHLFSVAGVVVDSQGVPIAGAEIRDAVGTRIVSSAKGTFSVPTAGRIRVRRLGYAPLDTTLPDGEGYRLVLRPSQPTLARVMVHPGVSGVGADADAGTSSAVTLSRRDLEARPQPGDDPLRALARVPGIASTEISARLRVRGGAADELLYLFDGAELPDPFHLPDLDAALSMVDLRAVGGIALHAGTLPLELGQRSAGALLFPLPAFSRSPRTASLSISATGARAAWHMPLGAQGDFEVIARRGYLDLVLNALGEADGLTPRYDDLYLRARRYGDRDRIAAHLLRGSDDLRYARDGDPAVTSRYRTTVGWITTEHERGRFWLTTTTSITQRVSQRDVLDEPGRSTRSAFQDARRTMACGLRADMRVALHDAHLLRVGGEWRPASSRFDLFRLRDTVAVIRGVRVRGIDTLALDDDLQSVRSGGWVGVRSALPWRVTQEVGVRLDAASWTAQQLLAPRGAWLLPITPRTSLRVGVGVTTQPHLPEERALADGDTTRYPATRATQRALGLAGERPGWRWRLDSYWRSTRDERPLWVNLKGGAIVAPELLDDRRRLNASRGEATGVEVALRDDGRSPWSWAASYILARTRMLVDGQWVRRPWDRQHTLALDLGRTVGAWQLAAGWLYHTGDPTSTGVVVRTPVTGGGSQSQLLFPRPFDRRLPAYHRLDARASRAFRRGRTSGRLFVDVLNLYNRANVRRESTTSSRTTSGVEQLSTRRETGLPFLPSVGLSLDWR